MIEIVVNGEKQTTEATTVADFVIKSRLRAERVAIELNLEILPRKQWNETQLREGDRLEIVHFVGGGR